MFSMSFYEEKNTADISLKEILPYVRKFLQEYKLNRFVSSITEHTTYLK